MLEKAANRSKAELAQITPEKLHQRGRRHCSGFGAENAPSQLDRLETLPLGHFSFLRRETALRSDNDQHRFDVAALLANLIERSLVLLFPENQLECLRRGIIEQFPVLKHRRDFGHARSATLLCRAKSDFPPAVAALDDLALV